MSDLISRQAAIDEIGEWIKAFLENGHKESAADACLIQDGIIQLPSAQPERKMGKWISTDDGWDGEYFVCSMCGCPWTLIEGSPEDNGMNFCPNCGADMRGEQNEKCG